MDDRVECTKCRAHMEPGYMVTVTAGGEYVRQQNWAPGEPHWSFWRGFRGLKKDQIIPITTLRCPNCGYLESYARKVAAPGK